MRLVFDPNSAGVAAATQMLVQSSLQQWLGDLIEVEDATVEGGDSKARVASVVRRRRTRRSSDVDAVREARPDELAALLPRRRRRLALVRASALNGIDFLEVLASQRTLLVHCLGRSTRSTSTTS